jgi:translocation and assembly module TamB
MNDTPDTLGLIEPPPETPRKRRKRRYVVAAGAALAAGGIVVTLGPAAPWFVEEFANNQRIWRLGRLQIEGVSGNWIGNLSVRKLSLEDSDGVWAEARDVSLDWRPLDLFGGLHIDSAHAGAIEILRQPILTEKRPPGRAGMDVLIDAIRVDDLHIAEAAFGEEARFSVDLGLRVREQTLDQLALDLQRLDSDADRALVRYDIEQVEALSVDVEGDAGGILTRVLGVPEQSVRLSASGDGDAQTGGARFDGALGDAELARGALRWTPTGWSIEGGARLDLLPATSTIAERIGANVALNATGARHGAFTAHAETPFLALDLGGSLDEDYALDGPARFTASTQRLSDIARESPFELGAATLTGELRRDEDAFAIRADLDARQIDALGRRARLTGPVQASLNPDRFTAEADLRAPQGAPALFANARLQTAFSYDRPQRRFELGNATLIGDALALDAQGWVNGGDGEFSGAWRVRQLGAIADDLRGEAGGRWRAFAVNEAQDERVWAIAVDGAGARVAGAPEIIPQLLGAAPRLDARLAYENGGITVQHARINGAQLRAGATGRIVRGEANLALEASARGPLNIGAAEITGAVDATGRLTGRIARPTLSATAQLAAFTSNGVVVDQPVVTFTLAPAGDAYRGHANVQGQVSGQPLTAEADVSIVGSALGLDNLVAEAGMLEARGRANLSPRGVDAQLALSGALDGLAPGLTGRVEGNATLTPEAVSINAAIADVRAGDLFVRAATIRAAGPYSAIAADFDLRGRLRRAPLRFAGTAHVSAADGATRASITGEGALAGADIATRAPITATWTDAAFYAALNVSIADGGLTAEWTERGRALTGSATIEDAPIAPLAAIWGETATGRIDGRFNLANAGNGLSGAADLTFEDARFAGRQRGTLDMHVVSELRPDRLQATIDAQSSDGLTARFEANAPVTTSAAPIRVALTPERRGRATWQVHGPADTLFAAARLADQQLTGQLDGEGELEFGAGTLTGDGRIQIAGGRFEDKLSGITLTDLDAEISIGDRGVNIERFTASSPSGGRLTATGGSANPREGRIAVNIDNMRVVDRPDARAQASGALALEWEGLDSSLSGALNISAADINIAQNPEAGIPTLDVIEINRPDEEDEITDAPIVARTHATRLDVRVQAPGRVFTRGRGVEAEWSLDLRLAGNSANPLLYGEANAIRGQLALSGQPFDIERGRIAFNGDPLDARIDLVAQRDTADLTAQIVLTGTAQDPDVTLTSDPGLPEDEILPQVLFGRSVADLSALEAAQIAAALASLSGRASFDLVDAARAAAGLDRFNVRQDEAGGFLVAGGVYLTRDVYVEVGRTGLGQASTRVEWTIRPRLVLITSFLGNGDQRASIRWRRETD